MIETSSFRSLNSCMHNMENEYLVSVVLLVIAFLYSSVGHGGASGYLAALGILGYNINGLRFSALILNVLVSSISFGNFFRKNFFDFRIFGYLAIGSVPMAYLGAQIPIDTFWYYRILGFCLILAAWRISGIGNIGQRFDQTRKLPFWIFIAIGASIGLISGMIGIGGGIILSPVLIMLKATDTKSCSGISALFILLNSVAGLFGGYHSALDISSLQPYWILAAFTGGLIGSFWGSAVAKPLLLRRILAGVLLIASMKMVVA